MQRVFLTILLLGGFLSYGCKKDTHTQTKLPQEQRLPNDAEWELDSFGEIGSENRRKVRQAATDYVKSRMPDWKVLGISSFAYTGSLYVVGIDVSSGDKRQTVNAVVRLFVQQDGATYWKADPLSQELAQALLSGYGRRKNRDLEKEMEQQGSRPDLE